MITVKKKFSHLGFAIIFYLVVSNILGSACATIYIIVTTFGKMMQSSVPAGDINAVYDFMLSNEATGSFGYIMASTIPSYLLGVPLSLLFLNMSKYRDVPLKGIDFSTPYEKSMKKDLTFKEFISFFFITAFFGIAGSIIASGTAFVFSLVTGVEMDDILSSFMNDMTLPQVLLVAVILAPIFEEIMFRYGVVGYCRRYGEWNAIIVSGVIFGLIHTNLFQFFYAFMLGAFFAYIYIYTRQLKYTIGLHVLFNFFGAFVPLLLSSQGENSPLTTGYEFLQYGAALVGLILFIKYIRQGNLFLTTPNSQVPGLASKDTYLNAGMICLIILSLILTVLMQFMLKA